MIAPERTLDGVLDAEFGGELRRFRLTVPELGKLQAETGVGAGVIVSELARTLQVLEHGEKNGLSIFETFALGLGNWKAEFVTRTIFHALVRGGASPNDAGRLVREWIEERGFAGLLENLALAWRIITAGMMSPEDQKVGEPKGAAATRPSAPRSRTARSASTSSTAGPPRSAGAPPTSPRPRSGSSPPRSKAGARPTRSRKRAAR